VWEDEIGRACSANEEEEEEDDDDIGVKARSKESTRKVRKLVVG
jgi:hypothetical protein